MPDETITLRDAARRLAKAKNPKAQGIQSAELFAVLRAGGLRAGFYMLDGTAWVEIPISYWERLRTPEFRKITRESDNPKSGSYCLQGNQFPDQITRIILARSNDADIRGETITQVVEAAGKEYEVTIKSPDFLKFLTDRGLEEKSPSSNVGAHQKQGWRDLCSYMAAYFVAHERDRPTEALKIEQAKNDIVLRAKDDDVKDLPAADSIKEQLSKAKNLIAEGVFRLKT